LLNKRLLVIRQVFKVDLEDHLIIHVDDCGWLLIKQLWSHRACQSVSTAKRGTGIRWHATSWEKPCGANPELSLGLRRTLDRMVVTKGVLVNLTLQLTRRESWSVI
jgi:hypothetical protein